MAPLNPRGRLKKVESVKRDHEFKIVVRRRRPGKLSCQPKKKQTGEKGLKSKMAIASLFKLSAFLRGKKNNFPFGRWSQKMYFSEKRKETYL